MPNYYGEDRYPLALIREFVRSQRNVEQSASLSRPEVKEQDIRLHGSSAQDVPDGPIDLLYRFTDDDQQTPALGFRSDKQTEQDDLYLLIYIDPSIERLWQQEMDRDRPE